jgi:hypothetical protein
MEKIILLLLTCMYLSCSLEKNTDSEVNHDNDHIDYLRTSTLESDTSFLDFFEKFMLDKEFQQSRVLFPFQQYDKIIKSAKEWEHLPFYANSEYLPSLSSDTVSSLELDLNLEKIDLFVLDFQKTLADKFTFKKVNANWHLQSVTKSTFKSMPDYEFIDFLTKFSTDSLFQINHISFPLHESFVDYETDYKIVSSTIELPDWKFWKLTNYLEGLLLISNIQTDHKYRNLFFGGIENGIVVKYTFEKVNAIWKLIRIEDYST